MKHSASFGFASSRSLFRHLAPFACLSLGIATLAIAPQIVFAQHAGGGHVGGGGGHFSPPPAPRPAPSMQQPHPASVPHPAPRVAYVPPRVVPAAAPPASAFHDPGVGNQVSNPQAGQPGQNIVVGFPPAQPGQFAQGNPASAGATTTRPGLFRRIFGDGHQIWSEPAHTGTTAASVNGSNTIAGSAFHGPAGLSPAATIPVAPAHVFNYPPGRFRGPIYFGPGYGFGYGYPFFGSPFGFGNSFFFGNSYFGYQVGSVFVPCNGFGPGLICMPYNYNYNFGYDSSYDSVTSAGPPDTELQSQQIYSPYSPALPPAEENTNGPSPDEYLLYLKDGAVYLVNDYWFADGKLVYATSTGQDSVDLDRIDMQKTLDVNAKRGLVFTLRPAPPADSATPQNDQSAPAPVPAPHP